MLKGYFRSSGIAGLAELFVRAKALILLPILTRAFGATDYGAWAQVSVLTSMISPLLVLGTDSAAILQLPGGEPRERQKGMSALLLYYGAASILVSGALLVAADPLADALFGGPTSAPLVVLCGPAILTTTALNWCRLYFRVEGQGSGYAAINVAQAVFGLAIAIVVAVSGSSVVALVLLTVAADGVLVAIVVGRLALRTRLARPDLAALGRMVRFGLALVPFGYAMWLLNLSDRLFVNAYWGLGEVGVYSVVYGVGYSLMGLLFNPIWLMYPSTASEMFNSGRADQMSQLYRHSTRAALAMLVPAMVGIGVLAVPLFRLLATDEFVRGAYVAPIVTLAYTLLMLSSYFDVSAGLVKRQWWSTASFGLAAAINLLLNALLVPSWGIAGAAVATLLGFAAHLGLMGYLSLRVLPLSFDWAFLAKVCCASCAMGIVLAYVYPLRTDGPVGLALAATVGALIYLGSLVTLRAVTVAEWRAVLGAVGLTR